MQRHYFIGIPIPNHIEEIAMKFKEGFSLHSSYKVLTHKDDFHVTLLYLGAVNEQHLDSVNNKLIAIAQETTSFTLSINGLSYFGSNTGPRVVYLSIVENRQLYTLQSEINDSIPQILGLPKNNRFVPHITIAKKRKTNDKTVFEKQLIAPVQIEVPSFSLFTIHPNRLPKYEAISDFQFAQQ